MSTVGELLPGPPDALPLPLGPLVEEPVPPDPLQDPGPDEGPEFVPVDCCESTDGESTGRARADATVSTSATTAQARVPAPDLIMTGP